MSDQRDPHPAPDEDPETCIGEPVPDPWDETEETEETEVGGD